MSKYIYNSTIAKIILKLENQVIYFYLENERRLLQWKLKSISLKSKEHIAFSSGQTQRRNHVQAEGSCAPPPPPLPFNF